MKNKKIITLILTIIVLTVISIYLYKNRGIFENLTKIKLIFLPIIIALQIIGLYLNGIFLKILARPFQINLKEHFSLSIASSFFNLITPLRGGAGLRAIYMKKIHNLSYVHFLASLFGNYLIIFVTASALALIISGILFIKSRILNLPLTLTFLAIFITSIVFIFFPKTFKKENFITQKINKVINGWKEILNHPKIIPKLILITFLQFIVSALAIYFIFLSLNQETTILKTLYLAAITVLAVFINITPGSLGITEGLYMISSGVLGITPALSLMIALILRAINTITLFILGPIANYILLSNKASK